MKKTTQLMEELNGSDDINSFLSNNKDSLDRQDFARYLCELVKKKKMTKIEVIRISQLNQIYGYQIFAGARLPSKDMIIAIALAMKLDVDTVQRLLTLAGEAQLYPKNTRDCILIDAINKGYDVAKLNKVLFEINIILFFNRCKIKLKVTNQLLNHITA